MRSAAFGLVLAVSLAGCILDSGSSSPDGAVYDVPDGAPYPGFRDGGGCSGTSGTSGGSSGTSGTCLGDGGYTPPPMVDAAPPDATPCDYVTFSYTDADATSVWVTGDWTSWAATPAAGAWQMSRSGDTWTRSGQIGAGRHPYKLIVDGDTWIADPSAGEFEDDGFGGQNSVITVVCD